MSSFVCFSICENYCTLSMNNIRNRVEEIIYNDLIYI